MQKCMLLIKQNVWKNVCKMYAKMYENMQNIFKNMQQHIKIFNIFYNTSKYAEICKNSKYAKQI